MHLAYTEPQQALARELRDYFARLMTPELREELHSTDGEYGDGHAYRRVVKQLGTDGWLASGRSAIEQLIFMDEAAIAGVPVPFLTLNTVAPTIRAFGTQAQKDYYLPRIEAGELHFSIGYSEPDAGTDLASLRTRAVRSSGGEEYVINGQKMWTSLIQYADYVWLACRTDPEAQRHRGLSIIIVPTDAPGFSWTPVRTMAGPTTSATYYQDVRVPVGNLVGEEHRGWPLITNQLNHERVALTSSAPIRLALREVTDWARETGAIEKEWVRLHLARVHAKVEFLKLINWRIASEAESECPRRPADTAEPTRGSSTSAGQPPNPAAASATKVFGTEFATEAYRLLMEVVGAQAYVKRGVLNGRLERMHRACLILTFGGGTNEVQRDIIATTGLGLPAPTRR